jgi:hypothetical protein
VLSYSECISLQGTVMHSPGGDMTLRPHAEVESLFRVDVCRVKFHLCMYVNITAVQTGSYLSNHTGRTMSTVVV